MMHVRDLRWKPAFHNAATLQLHINYNRISSLQLRVKIYLYRLVDFLNIANSCWIMSWGEAQASLRSLILTNKSQRVYDWRQNWGVFENHHHP